MITLCWEAEKITITKEELTLLTRHVKVPQTLKGNNMWKLIDCGTYPWFIKKSHKFYHCVYGLDGEYKKIRIQNSYIKTTEKVKYSYVKDWLSNDGFEKHPCTISKKTYQWHKKQWKGMRLTVLMKEILKQLKDSRVASS